MKETTHVRHIHTTYFSTFCVSFFGHDEQNRSIYIYIIYQILYTTYRKSSGYILSIYHMYHHVSIHIDISKYHHTLTIHLKKGTLNQQKFHHKNHTVDGSEIPRSPVDMEHIPLFTGF